jgi:hypothetical protein
MNEAVNDLFAQYKKFVRENWSNLFYQIASSEAIFFSKYCYGLHR